MSNKKTIEADVEVVSSTKSRKQKPAQPSKQSKPSQSAQKPQADNPFAAFGAGAAGGAQGMPDLSALFGKDGMPDLSKIPGIPLKQRLMFKFMGLLNNPKIRFLRSKWSIPLWGIIAILVIALALTAGLLFLVYKLIRALLSPYFQLFKKK